MPFPLKIADRIRTVSHSLWNHVEETPCWRGKWKKKNPSSGHCHCITNPQQATGVSFGTEQVTAIRCWLGLWSPEDTGADCMFLAYIFKTLTTTVADTRDFDWGFYQAVSHSIYMCTPPKRRSYRKLNLCVIQTQQGWEAQQNVEKVKL